MQARGLEAGEKRANRRCGLIGNLMGIDLRGSNFRQILKYMVCTYEVSMYIYICVCIHN